MIDHLFKPISRLRYAVIGIALMLFKYTVEFVTVFFVTGKCFSPIAFLLPIQTLRTPYIENFQWLGWTWAIWSIPFLMIAIWLSVRRSIDAKLPAHYGLAVAIPFMNFFVMLLLATIGQGREEPQAKPIQKEEPYFPPRPTDTSGNWTIAVLAGAFAGACIMLLATLLSVYFIESYGFALFLGMPFVAGVTSGLVGYQLGIRTFFSAAIIGVLSILLGGTCLLMFAFEGVICLVMAAPLVIPLGAVGGLFGAMIGVYTVRRNHEMYLSCVVGILPLFSVVEQRTFEPPIRMVESEIVIDASREAVWNAVVEFPEIKSKPEGIFRYGIAFPVRARIDGEGVGAIRYCEFDTGKFVEPITVWDAPNHLAFDVTEQPLPMKEMTPYRDIHPPHLDWSFKSQRGEFVLESMPDGRTKLIGRTWYVVDMGPQIYWHRWTDWIIHKIHLRVLNHIKDTAE